MLKNIKHTPTNLKHIPIEQLQRGKYQPRQTFDKNKIAVLAESIREHGIIQPLVVRPLINQPGTYEIIAGERRWRAAQLAGLHEVPCLIGDYADKPTAHVALIENLIRADLNVIEKAKGIARLIEEFDYTHEEAANNLGLSRPEITNLLRLLKLDASVQLFLIEGSLSESQGKLLAGVPLAQQYEFAKKTIAKRWTTRALELAIKASNNSSEFLPTHKTGSNPNQNKLNRELSDYLGVPVVLETDAKNKGYLQLHFNSLDELDGLFDKLGFRYD